jgi:hypothetical protein
MVINSTKIQLYLRYLAVLTLVSSIILKLLKFNNNVTDFFIYTSVISFAVSLLISIVRFLLKNYLK